MGPYGMEVQVDVDGGLLYGGVGGWDWGTGGVLGW